MARFSSEAYSDENVVEIAMGLIQRLDDAKKHKIIEVLGKSEINSVDILDVIIGRKNSEEKELRKDIAITASSLKYI